MPKIGKNHLIKKTKLVKTTTFFTLLIAATLIFSSLAPAAMLNEDQNVNEDVPQLLNTDLATSSSEISELMEVLEKPYIFEDDYRGTIIWDNYMGYIGLFRGEVGSGVTSELADDFKFNHDTRVDDVHWIGGYWAGSAQTPWCIKFWEDDGDKPGDVYAGPFCYDWDEIEKSPVGSYYLMEVDLPESVYVSANTKYWISIYAEGSSSAPYAGWAAHLSPIILHEGLWRWPEYGYPDWVSTNAITGYGPADFCYRLTLKPEHDVGVDSIDSPFDLQELCGCLPVAVTVGNYGVNDEEDVPVVVDIFTPLFSDSFETGMGSVWETIGCIDCSWSLTTFDSGNPSVVTPRSGMYMAELNSGNGGAGGSCILAEVMFENLEDYCEPGMSFYMWHDTYGSDDYIEVLADRGMGWEVVGGPYYRLCCPGCPVGWKQHQVSLASFAGEPWVKIAFRGVCDANPSAYNLHIDDVTKIDLEFHGETTVDVAAGETVEVEFDDEWCPCQWGEVFNTFMDFEIVACTGLDTDENPANDCDDETITLYFPFEIDIAAISVDEPCGQGVAGPNTVKGTIKNVGQTDQFCFKAKMGVYEVDVDNLFDEPFEDWELDPDRYPTYYSYYRPVGWDEDGCSYNAGWEEANSDLAGGTAPEAELHWIDACYYGSGNTITSPPINTLGVSSLLLEYKSFLDVYYTNYIRCYVEISTDGMSWDDITPWPNPVPGDQSAETHEFDATAYMSSSTQVRFRFYGYYYALNWWNIDDVRFIGKSPAATPEYFEEVCVDLIEVCEEKQLDFPDWTPATPWPDCDSKLYFMCLEVNPCDPIDQNPLNNKVCKEITVDFWHDVAIEITSPAAFGEKIDWLRYDDGSCENSLGLTAGGMLVEAIALTPDELAGYSGYAITEVIVHHGCELYGQEPLHDYTVFCYRGTSPPADPFVDGTIVATGSHEGSEDVVIDITDFPFSPSDTVFVGVGWEHSSGSYPCGFDTGSYVAGKSGWLWYSGGGWTELYLIGFAGNWMIQAGIEEAGGPPPIDVYIPCGEQDLCATVDNLGVFDESVDVYMALYEFITDPEVGTLIMEEFVDNVAIGPLTAEEVCFGTFDFADSGAYKMVVEADVMIDCYPDNNDDSIGIGVDCCAPHSGHMPDPQYPNGENNWYTRSVDVEITAIDLKCPDPCWGTASGVKEIHYIINSGSEVIVPGDSAEFKLTADGVHLVEYWAVDNAGNVEDPFTFEIAIDKTAPGVSLLYNVFQDDAGAWHVDFTAAASDATSGTSRVEFYIGSSLEKTDTEPPYEWSIDWIDDYKTVTFKAMAYDNAGNDADDSVPGSEIAEEINAHSHAQLKSKTHSIVFNQQPRSR
jgi:hypothetical protein